MQRGQRFVFVGADIDAFPCGKAVIFDDHVAAKLSDAVNRRRIVPFEHPEIGGGDAIFRHELLGENFRAFQLCGAFRWAEHLDAASGKFINNSGD